MIEFKEFTLDNGLQVFVREDDSTPMAVVNILYKVGSRDEQEHLTGLAHLFEHLMFGGSKNIPLYDEPLQLVGGENNAFTSPDITNYYVTLPANNLETAFWLESDRMLSLSFDPEVLDVQKKVVIEEFKQRYLNQPYGDLWLKLRPLAYKKHPYRWATIGKEIEHIEKVKMEDIRAFFNKFYCPSNAIMVVAGKVSYEQVKQLSEKWFGPIPSGEKHQRKLPLEPQQKEARKEVIEGDVAADAIYKVFHMPGRLSKDYYTADLLSDILGRSKSSRLFEKLVKDKELVSDISAYVTGSMDPGLLVITATLKEGIAFEEVDREINQIVDNIRQKPVGEKELLKIKNKAESTIAFGEVELLNQAINIAFGAYMGNPNLINEETKLVQEVTSEGILEMAQKMLVLENSSTIYYKARKK